MTQEERKRFTAKFTFKIVVVGNGGVGKSTMIQRLLTGKFIAQKITIGTDLASYHLDIEDDEGNSYKVTLQLWDFAGEKRFRFFLPRYARGAQGCLLCYDITRYSSFEELKDWFKIVDENATEPVYILVGMKKDLEIDKRVVSFDEGQKFLEEYKIEKFYETSSLSGENNKEIFETLTREILKVYRILK
ncbi:MAG: GTP-binding protein [Promethearchaeota archaeon]